MGVNSMKNRFRLIETADFMQRNKNIDLPQKVYVTPDLLEQ